MGALAFCLLLAGGGVSDLEDLARSRSLQWTCDAATGRHVVRAGAVTLVFAPGLPTALVNGAPVPLSRPVAVELGRLKLPPELSRHVEAARPRGSEAPLVRATEPAKPPVAPAPKKTLPPVVIAIDPGHGGMHTGGKGRTGLLEKDINLHVSLELQKILEGWGARVVMTRVHDRHLAKEVDDDLDRRVAIVNGAAPDLFLSIHANYVDSAVPRGFEVWVPRAGGARGAASRDLAKSVLGELEGVWTSENRGVKDDHNLRVLKGTTCPAVLVELEFVSNPQAERQLANPARRVQMAEALAEAVRKWVTRRQ